MSYETWVSILLTALGVMLAAVTFFAAVVGIGIAIFAFVGVRQIKQSAATVAKKSVEDAIAQYPQASQFLDLYRNLQGQLVEFQKEYAVWQERSATANKILVRLNSGGAITELNSPTDDKDSGLGIPSYPTDEPQAAVDKPTGGEKK